MGNYTQIKRHHLFELLGTWRPQLTEMLRRSLRRFVHILTFDLWIELWPALCSESQRADQRGQSLSVLAEVARRRHRLLLAGTSSQTRQQHSHFITFSFQGRVRHCRHAPPQAHHSDPPPKSQKLLLLFAPRRESFLGCASSGSAELAAGCLFNSSPWYRVLTSAVWPLARSRLCEEPVARWEAQPPCQLRFSAVRTRWEGPSLSPSRALIRTRSGFHCWPPEWNNYTACWPSCPFCCSPVDIHTDGGRVCVRLGCCAESKTLKAEPRTAASWQL